MVFITDMNLMDCEQARTRAAAYLRRLRQQAVGVQLTILPHYPVECQDVVSVTDPQVGLIPARLRVSGVRLTNDPVHRTQQQTLTL